VTKKVKGRGKKGKPKLGGEGAVPILLVSRKKNVEPGKENKESL